MVSFLFLKNRKTFQNNFILDKNTVLTNTLADACEVCLQVNDSVIPRSEVVEHCAICLLNLGRWEFLINLDKRWITFEITSTIALNCQELSKHKGTKKLSKNLWDLGKMLLIII